MPWQAQFEDLRKISGVGWYRRYFVVRSSLISSRWVLCDSTLYLRGVLDQGYYPEMIYTPTSLELLETQARLAKAFGCNPLRIHIKVEDPRYYEVADRLSLLVWSEISNWALLTDDSAERAWLTFDGMLNLL